jgi:hypothetical protein
MPGNESGQIKMWHTVALSGVLWLASAGLGLYAVYSIYKLAIMVYALFGKDYYSGVVIGQVATLAAGLVWLVAIVFSGETLFKHAGENKTFRLLGWMIGIELVLIVLGIFFG